MKAREQWIFGLMLSAIFALSCWTANKVYDINKDLATLSERVNQHLADTGAVGSSHKAQKGNMVNNSSP